MSQRERRSDWIIFGFKAFAIAGFIVSAWLIFGDSSTSARTDQRGPAVTPARSQAARGYTTKPIEKIRVGDRVYAHNPEVDEAERAAWAEPDWNDWLHLSLVMPKEDGSELQIELLRPESWVMEQVSYIAKENRNPTFSQPKQAPLATLAGRGAGGEGPTARQSTSTVSDKTLAVGEIATQSTQAQSAASISPRGRIAQASSTADGTIEDDSADDRRLAPRRSQGSKADSVPLSPLRPFYREVVIASALLEAAEAELVGLTVEMDLPEMGATGTAVIVDVAACPPVRSGEGQPVTATFSHPPSTTVLNVIFEGEPEPIGVTDNHLFWSVDRQQFLAIGKMEIGETVQTFHGETKRIEAKLPRPGPEVVYNLEVYGEHVYFVGEQGLLAHNTYTDKFERLLDAGYDAGQAARILRKAGFSYDDDFVKWYRSQTDGINDFIRVDAVSGSIAIQSRTLNISTVGPSHARYFGGLGTRPGAHMVEFQVPKWFHEFVLQESVRHSSGISKRLGKLKTRPENQGGLAPLEVDWTVTPRDGPLFQLRANPKRVVRGMWNDWILEVVRPGSGVRH